jgi:hypothetical protein
VLQGTPSSSSTRTTLDDRRAVHWCSSAAGAVIARRRWRSSTEQRARADRGGGAVADVDLVAIAAIAAAGCGGELSLASIGLSAASYGRWAASTWSRSRWLVGGVVGVDCGAGVGSVEVACARLERSGRSATLAYRSPG